MLSKLNSQQGVGLIEVLVALLVLAIGILGFLATQTKALTASDDALLRTKAITLVRETTERIRNNSIKVADVTKYQTYLNGSTVTKDTELDECASGCDVDTTAKNDVIALKKAAYNDGLTIKMTACPGNKSGLTRECILVAWGDTNPTFGTDTNTDCMKSNGIYHPKSQCIVMEAY